jgi:hypothetical protein
VVGRSDFKLVRAAFGRLQRGGGDNSSTGTTAWTRSAKVAVKIRALAGCEEVVQNRALFSDIQLIVLEVAWYKVRRMFPTGTEQAVWTLVSPSPEKASPLAINVLSAVACTGPVRCG